MSKIPPNNSKLTYVWEQYLFHYVSEGGFTYLVMADDAANVVAKAAVGFGPPDTVTVGLFESGFVAFPDGLCPDGKMENWEDEA